MRKTYRFYKLAILALLALGIQSCHKENGIDNNNVIKKPYGLFIGDQQGALYRTNTGDSMKMLFPPDGYPIRSIITSGNNILLVKNNTHISLNNGDNFNPTDSSVIKPAFWESIMLDVPSHNRVYLSSFGLSNGIPSTGIIFSEDNGQSWQVDTLIDPNITIGRTTSLAQLKNGVLFAHDYVGQKLYIRNSKTDRWKEVTTTGLPSGSAVFYLSHINNSLLLTDYSGAQGVWHSENMGQTWAQYPGLPAVRLFATFAPFDQDLLVGTETKGVYILKNGAFVSDNNGLKNNSSVRAIAGKDDVYKNDVTKQYYYLATSAGLYRSEDNGQNWIMTIPGDFAAFY